MGFLIALLISSRSTIVSINLYSKYLIVYSGNKVVFINKNKTKNSLIHIRFFDKSILQLCWYVFNILFVIKIFFYQNVL